VDRRGVRAAGLRLRLALPAALVALAAAGCAADDPGAGSQPGDRRAVRPRAKRDRVPRVEPVRCSPAAPPGCRSASGRVIYVEAVDPDGDGDAHFVLSSREGITGPGLTVIDVKRSLRPRPLPRVGDAVAAAGPVYRGSYGQRQIEAVKLRVARAGR
jgi:hypothetical protein